MLVRALSGVMLMALVAAACGGTAVIGDTGGNGGASASANSSSDSTSSTTATTSSGGQVCSENMPCPATHYCATAPGACDAIGSCQLRPEVCDKDCPGVCGCDGQFYCNACEAQNLGVDVSTDTSCIDDDIEYVAWAWPGGLDHMVIGKANYTKDTCTLVYLDAPTMPNPMFMINVPPPWAVNAATATHSAMDCFDMQPDQAVFGASAQGTIDWVPGMMLYPCDLSIDAVVSFDNPPPWLSPTVAMTGAAVVQGGCF